ncbi:glutathione S-transferase N-terminal domain-containing protein [Leisingera sp. M658]|uniref:glutathione S-transferase N-terminal domain-containing protein n=1 Tax=Leisingera sp. M658 TaxID=2867015 RepID=UPI0021A4831D|nr:glutathione S-transferase N-terminal domain-containing protein [Leisingera sp. M658]UWQ76097.1 glutathione S-transferase N-terminal domain-containing protein [Leisingera sp. M658]
MREPIQLFYWPTPNGWKISIALEEMGLPYDVSLVDITNGDQFAPEFLNISPNNRMPAIIDPGGPGGTPVSLFESGAILQYLARKTGQFYGADERARLVVDQWLMWQMGGVGPMAGQAHHFLKYAPEDLPYAKDRYRNEVARLYGVLDRQLAENEYVTGPDCTISDMAIWPWASLWEGQQQVVEDKPHLARWLELMWSRPGVVAGRALHAELRGDRSDTKAQQVLFGN